MSIQKKEECLKPFLVNIGKLADCTTATSIAMQLIEDGKFEPVKAELAYAVTGDNLKKLIPKSFDQVFNEQHSTIASLKKYRGQSIQRAFVYGQMVNLCDLFSVGKGISEGGLDYLTEVIIENYFYFTVADFKHFIFRAVKGDFGKTYDRLDAPTILGWFDVYCNERLNYSEDSNTLLHQKTKVEKIDGEATDAPQDFKEWAEKFIYKYPTKENRLNKKGDTEIDGFVKANLLNPTKSIKDDSDYHKKKKEYDEKTK